MMVADIVRPSQPSSTHAPGHTIISISISIGVSYEMRRTHAGSMLRLAHQEARHLLQRIKRSALELEPNGYLLIKSSLRQLQALII